VMQSLDRSPGAQHNSYAFERLWKRAF
jgi:hypothetical protein